MKRLMIQTIFAAAAAFCASGAYAQTMTAKVPFPFYMNGAAMPAGQYDIRVDSAPNQIVLRNAAARRLAVSFVSITDLPQKMITAGKATMMFECTDGDECVLVKVWQGGGTPGLQVAAPKLRNGRELRSAAKELRVVHAD
jgi:hypothetical protein